MCYMVRRPQVGIREMRQNLSVYVERVLAGETLEVTDRGRPVAILAPIAHDESTLSRLTREGHIIAATGSLPAKRIRARTARWASDQLQRMRADRDL